MDDAVAERADASPFVVTADVYRAKGDQAPVTEEVGMTNDVNYFEIGSPDPEASKAFYGALFDWSVGEPSMPARYSMINENGGGLWDTSQMGAGNWAIFYVQVGDVATAIERAVDLGASVIVPLVDNGQIEFAHLSDPFGNRFGIWRPKAAA